MNLPSNLTEAQILKAIESVVSKLARSFKFGYHTLNDMKQQGYLFAIDGMTRYDPNRKLENFLYSHLKNRYINFIRDNYKRNDPTCKFCHTSITCPNKREGENFCDIYARWHARNVARAIIMTPLDISNIDDENEKNTRRDSDIINNITIKEAIRKIDIAIPIELRSSWLQLRHGVSVPKVRREKVISIINKILGLEYTHATSRSSRQRRN